MKLYSKLVPGVWAERLSEPDWRGQLALRIHWPEHEAAGPDGLPFTAIGTLDEWSEVELAPTPPTVPETVYLVLWGEDPVLWQAEVAATEREAAATLAAKGDKGFGYVPAYIATTQMRPA